MLLCKPVIIICSGALISGRFENKELRDGLVKMQQNYFFFGVHFFFLMADFSPKKVLSEICCIIIINVYIPRTDIYYNIARVLALYKSY